MSEAIKGDPEIDSRFLEDLSCMVKEVTEFTEWCLSETLGGKTVIHNLGQKESREGVVAMDILIGQFITLRGHLFKRNDICNEQGRGGLSSRITKLRNSIAGVGEDE
jgi:hypothetical protein